VQYLCGALHGVQATSSACMNDHYGWKKSPAEFETETDLLSSMVKVINHM